MTRVFRTPLVAFAFVVDRLRRLPGAGFVEEHKFWVVGGLLVAAAIVLGAWAATRSPQRVSMADLTAGSLAPLQTWIIITGDMRAEGQVATGYRYILTDPNITDATLAVTSRTELPVGLVTVSGTLVGGNAPQHEGFAWYGQLVADPLLAREPDPPWLAIGLATFAGFIAAAGRTSYPLFFKETPTQLTARAGSLRVQARRDWPPDPDAVDATLTMRPGEPLEVTSRRREATDHPAPLGAFERGHGRPPDAFYVRAGARGSTAEWRADVQLRVRRRTRLGLRGHGV